MQLPVVSRVRSGPGGKADCPLSGWLERGPEGEEWGGGRRPKSCRGRYRVRQGRGLWIREEQSINIRLSDFDNHTVIVQDDVLGLRKRTSERLQVEGTPRPRVLSNGSEGESRVRRKVGQNPGRLNREHVRLHFTALTTVLQVSNYRNTKNTKDVYLT